MKLGILRNTARIMIAAALGLLPMSESAQAVTGLPIAVNSATGGNAACSGTTISTYFSVTGTNTDASPAGNPPQDRFVVRVIDATGGIIGSGGLVVANGSTLLTTWTMTVGSNNMFGVTPSSDTIVAATERPFTVQVFESNTTGVGVSPYVATGGPISTSPAFDPASGTGSFTAGCSVFPVGRSPQTQPHPLLPFLPTSQSAQIPG